MRRPWHIPLLSLLPLVAAGGLCGASPTSVPGPLLGPDTLSVAHRAAMESELDGLRAAVARDELGWRAGETSMLRLTPEERLRRLAERPWPQTSRGGEAARGKGRKTLPPRIDWRDARGDFVSGVREQASCADGWIFAATGALESAFLRATKGGRLPDFDLAEQQALSCLDDYGLGRGCEGGWPEDVFWLAENVGLLEEGCQPYAGDPQRACDSHCPDADARRWRFAADGLVCAAADPVAIKRALVERGPLVTTLSVDAGFMAYAGGVYRPLGPVLGYHALLLVGYDDAEGCFLVKNSWGEGWGEAGFARIAYDADCDLGNWTRWVEFDPSAMGPFAAMKPSAQRARSGESLTFRDRSLGVNAPITVWEWDLDGDGVVDATGPGPQRFVYVSAGRYTPTLRVVDAQGREARRALEGGVEIVFDGPLWTVDAAAGAPDGDGSPARPFADIQQAINAAAPGDTVRVLPGVYRGAMNTALDNAGKALLLLAAGEPGDVRIDGEGEHRLLRLDAAGTPVGSASPLVRLEGFTLERGADPLRGGGILAEGVSLELVDCTVENCQTLKDVGAGGAIWCDRDLRLERCSFLENRSGGDGGAIFAAGGSVQLDGCRFDANAAGAEGGALWQGGGVLAAARSAFVDNAALLRGGALGLLGVNAGLDALRFTGNVVTAPAGDLRGGGAVAWEAPGADLLVTNCLFTGNEAPEGGALRADGGRLSGAQLTFWGNRALRRGGALALMGTGEADPVIANSILWGDAAPEASEFAAPGGAEFRHCVLAGGAGGKLVIDLDPRFRDPDGGDFSLDDDSPCLGAGAREGVPALDLDGEPRPQPAGSLPDLGALESPLTGSTAVPETAPSGLVFGGAYPNPFNPRTTFSFSLPAPGDVTLQVFQSSGRQVAEVLEPQPLAAGDHSVPWVARDEAGQPLASGIYLARLSVHYADGGEDRAMQKVLLVK